MALNYTSTMTYAQARTELASRLFDGGTGSQPAKVFYTDAELKLYILEALRTWNSYSHLHKDVYQFPTQASTLFYDLTIAPNTVIPMTLKDQDVVNDIAIALMETMTTWPGVPVLSEQFDLNSIVGAVQRRRDQLLLETSMIVSFIEEDFAPQPFPTMILGDSVIDVRSVMWKDAATNLYTVLQPSDELALDAFLPGWSVNTGPPTTWTTFLMPPLSLTIAPGPSTEGRLHLVTINSGATLSTSGNGTLLGVPNDFVWVIKFGAMADLLGRDGEAFDPTRSAYCQKRWEEGVEAARLSMSTARAFVDGVQIPVGSLYDMNRFRSNWPNETPGTPGYLGMIGFNLVALAPKANAGPHSLFLHSYKNAPVPVNDGDFLQVSKESLDVILDYAQHLASFKMAGEEFNSTMDHYKRFVSLALDHNSRLKATSKLFSTWNVLDRRFDSQYPMREPKEANAA